MPLIVKYTVKFWETSVSPTCVVFQINNIEQCLLGLRITQHTTTVPVRINGALCIKFSYVFILVLTTHCTLAFDWHNSCFDSCVSCPYEYASVREGVSRARVYLCVYVLMRAAVSTAARCCACYLTIYICIMI